MRKLELTIRSFACFCTDQIHGLVRRVVAVFVACSFYTTLVFAQVPVEGDKTVLEKVAEAYQVQRNAMENFDATIEIVGEPENVTAKYSIFHRNDRQLIHVHRAEYDDSRHPGLVSRYEFYSEGEQYREIFDRIRLDIRISNMGGDPPSPVERTLYDDAIFARLNSKMSSMLSYVSPQGVPAKFSVEQKGNQYEISRYHGSDIAIKAIVDPKYDYRVTRFEELVGYSDQHNLEIEWSQTADHVFFPKSGRTSVRYLAGGELVKEKVRTWRVEKFDPLDISNKILKPTARNDLPAGTAIYHEDDRVEIIGGQQGEHLHKLRENIYGITFRPTEFQTK